MDGWIYIYIYKNIDCHKININRINQQTDSFLIMLRNKRREALHFNGRFVLCRLVHFFISFSSLSIYLVHVCVCFCRITIIFMKFGCTRMAFKIFNLYKVVEKWKFFIWVNQCVWASKVNISIYREKSRQRNVHKKCIELFILRVCVCLCVCMHACCVQCASLG